MQVKTFTSVELIRNCTPAWDSLWHRSCTAVPTLRPPYLAQWLEMFASGSRTEAIAIEENGDWVAGLPVIASRLGGLIEVGTLPANDWAMAGDLLIDPQSDMSRTMDRLAAALLDLPWPILRLHPVRLDAPPWQDFLAACRRAGLTAQSDPKFLVGQVQLPTDFEQYRRSWSGNHRRHMNKANRRFDAAGGGELIIYDRLRPDEVEPILLAGFQIEDRSWKGAQEGSVLRQMGMFEFYLRQARELAGEGQLHLAFLTHRGRPIAFEYGWLSKGVYFSPKVGYDEQFARFTPGQLLRYRLFERFCKSGHPPQIDFHGPLSDATGKWITHSYPVGTFTIALRPITGRLLLSASRALTHIKRSKRSACAFGGTDTPGDTAIAT